MKQLTEALRGQAAADSDGDGGEPLLPRAATENRAQRDETVRRQTRARGGGSAPTHVVRRLSGARWCGETTSRAVAVARVRARRR
jgi:hypothetical protein